MVQLNGIIQMTKYFSVNALSDGANIRVNAVAPGGVKNHQNPQGEDFQKITVKDVRWIDWQKLKKLQVQYYIYSEDASYINGHTFYRWWYDRMVILRF